MNTCFHIKVGNGTGTAFIRGKGVNTYFVTAAHVVENLTSGETIQLQRQEGWVSVVVKTVQRHPDNYDVAIFTTIGPQSMPIEFNEELPHLPIGTELKFLGFPHGLTNSYPSPTGFSTPFVRTAFFSGLYLDNEIEYLVLDGFNNPGYSGGPIYGPSAFGKLTFVGVVSGYRVEHFSHSGVYQLDGNGQETALSNVYVKPNSGMVLATALGKINSFLAENLNFNEGVQA
jgi:hypothetical protein